ncbi:hypothetical protein Y1Q_0018615 [Alligator mississippiensis]|uniref:Uncharacterized protein n=1 Tax=Alligator mississippiensis TaxID=8496 RepID=A0A151NRU9_ALLMI|nr:hypothetical protein Y1Q_0018615 [Alligator mississippiensis]
MLVPEQQPSASAQRRGLQNDQLGHQLGLLSTLGGSCTPREVVPMHVLPHINAICLRWGVYISANILNISWTLAPCSRLPCIHCSPDLGPPGLRLQLSFTEETKYELRTVAFIKAASKSEMGQGSAPANKEEITCIPPLAS